MLDSRGVAEQEMRDRHDKRDGNGRHDHGCGHEMNRDDRFQVLHTHQRQTVWIYWTLPILGIWILLAPFTFGYLNEDFWVDPSGRSRAVACRTCDIGVTRVAGVVGDRHRFDLRCGVVGFPLVIAHTQPFQEPVAVPRCRRVADLGGDSVLSADGRLSRKIADW